MLFKYCSRDYTLKYIKTPRLQTVTVKSNYFYYNSTCIYSKRHSRNIDMEGELVQLVWRFLVMVGGLEALPVDDGGASLIVLLLADPHLLEGGQGGQDGAANPDGVFPLRGGDDLMGRNRCTGWYKDVTTLYNYFTENTSCSLAVHQSLGSP